MMSGDMASKQISHALGLGNVFRFLERALANCFMTFVRKPVSCVAG